MAGRQIAGQRLWTLSATAIAFAGIGVTSHAFAEEKIGKVQQPLVGGEEVSEKTEEAYGLLRINNGCSASLLQNGWAITAAHCVDATDANGNKARDPARPGQNVLRPIAGMTFTARWGGGQSRIVARVETFWPYDVALAQLDSPIVVNGTATGYVRDVFYDQFPYFGSPGGAPLKVFGQGINQFATGSGVNAVPAQQSDGKYTIGR